MGITYNDWQNLGYIYTCDGGVFSANNAANAVFDYFPDDAAVNDALYFGCLGGFDDIKVYIGTPFAATSVTFVWEYWNGSTWATLSVTDGTNNWTNTGERIVTFVPPTHWLETTVNGISNTMWIRCRISAINSPTEGGANSTQVCQCGNNRITVTGYSEVTPCTLTDIYNADVAGGWGVVTRQGDTQFKVNAYLVIAANSYLADTGKSVEFGKLISISGYVRFGSKATVSGVNLGYDGCLLYSTVAFNKTCIGLDSGASFLLYGCSIQSKSSRNKISSWGNAAKTEFINTIIGTNVETCEFRGANQVAENCVFRYAYSDNTVAARSTTSFDGSIINRYLNVNNATNFEIANAKVVGYPLRLAKVGSPGNIIIVVTDCDIDSYQYLNSHGGINQLTVKKTFNLKVVDSNGTPIEGANVSMFDVNDNIVFSTTTGASGDIAEQKIPYELYYYSGTTGYVYYSWNEPSQTYTPHTVTISKAGYKTRTIQYTMDRKREEIEMLEPEVPAAPSNLTATAASRTQINLSWHDNSDNETGFRIERSPNGTTYWTHIATTDANVTAHLDGDLQCGTTYYYRVCAVNDVGLSDYSNVAGTATEACPVPAVVMELESMIP